MGEPSPFPSGRFDVPLRVSTLPRLLLAGIWDGMRLRCPSCSEGRLFARGIDVHAECPRCGAPFERPGQGDFIGAMVTAYAITACIFLTAFVLLHALTELDMGRQLWLSVPIALTFVLAFYRNMKGIWIAILIPLVKWLR